VKDESNDIVKDLMTRHLSGEATPEEEKNLFGWIGQNAENEKEYQAFKKVFELSERHYAAEHNALPQIDIDHEWNHFLINVREKETPVRKLDTRLQTTGLWYKIAAAVLLLMVSGYVIYILNFRTEDFRFETAEVTQTLSLPDGSEIILNKHSQLAYTSDFGDGNRKVKLTGEAFFKIKRDESRPFIIDVKNAAIEVLGTSFNVRAYDNMKEVEVVVETGVVKLSVPEKKTEVKLTAGQKGTFSQTTDALTKEVNTDINFQAWNTQKIVFEKSDLKGVVEALNKIYQTNIVIMTDVPPTCEVTVSFDHQTLESVLHVLENTLNLTYRITGNKIEIIAAGC
jgi:transmembrane sensor